MGSDLRSDLGKVQFAAKHNPTLDCPSMLDEAGVCACVWAGVQADTQARVWTPHPSYPDGLCAVSQGATPPPS